MPTTILVAYRKLGAPMWTHHFRVEPFQWDRFYALVAASTLTSEYARIVAGEYLPVLA